MCLWLLTTCLGLLPNPSPTVIVVGVPTAILQPTTTTAATTITMATTRPPPPPPMNTTVTPTTATPPPPPPPPTTITTTTVTRGGQAFPVILCNDPDVICVANPDESDTGTIPIDPRLGTTPATNAAYQAPQIVGYSYQQPSYDTAVKFPREKREIMFKHRKNILNFNITAQDVGNHVARQKRQTSCLCVPAGTCSTTNGNIDFRIVTPTQCPAGQVYCCGIDLTKNLIACGTQQKVPAVSVTPGPGQANFGEYPWQAMILTKQNDYIAGGVLIDQLNVLTVTHRMLPYIDIATRTAPNVKVRLGEWDAAGTYEPVLYQEFTVQKIFTHPSYDPGTLQYDIMVLRLASAVPISPLTGSATTINRACLPPSSATSYVGQRCWVSGWGKDMFGLQGQYQQILKKVEVPIVNPTLCQVQLQAARLGANYILDTTSFLCAGGEASKDSCTGDGGSGLVCNVNGQWVLTGLVAWGLGCANANVPGVYVNIAALLPWIQQQVATP